MDRRAGMKIVITGGPGAGKSTLVDALAALGYGRTSEAGRAVIQAEMARGGAALPWRDRTAFAAAMLGCELHSWAQAVGRPVPVFFDRGLVDIDGYLSLSGLPALPGLHDHITRHRYDAIFIAPPWRDIYVNDAERRQDYSEAVRTFHAMVAAYARHGYAPIELPRAPVEARTGFVLERLGLPAAGTAGRPAL